MPVQLTQPFLASLIIKTAQKTRGFQVKYNYIERHVSTLATEVFAARRRSPPQLRLRASTRYAIVLYYVGERIMRWKGEGKGARSAHSVD